MCALVLASFLLGRVTAPVPSCPACPTAVHAVHQGPVGVGDAGNSNSVTDELTAMVMLSARDGGVATGGVTDSSGQTGHPDKTAEALAEKAWGILMSRMQQQQPAPVKPQG